MIAFHFPSARIPASLERVLVQHGHSYLPKAKAQLCTVESVNIILHSFAQISFGPEPRHTRDKKINKHGVQGWLVFASENGDDYLALDFNPGPNGIAGQVIRFCLEDDRFKVLAENFDAFWANFGLLE